MICGSFPADAVFGVFEDDAAARKLVADLVNYLVFMGEPVRAERAQIGYAVLLGLGVLFVLTYLLSGPTGMFGLIGIAAALIYLLDVRPGLKDLSDGKGFW